MSVSDVVVFAYPVLSDAEPNYVGEEGWLGLVMEKHSWRIGRWLVDFGDWDGDLSKTNTMWVNETRLENLGPL